MSLTTSPPDTAKARWFHSIWFVLGMLFFVMGPFGLPLLWKSPRFAPWAKVALTILTALYTYWLVILTLQILRSVMSDANQLNLLGS